jgi:hypothetical protein
MAANQELATGYAALILADQNLEITADKIKAIGKAAGITIEPIWATTFERVLKGRKLDDLLVRIFLVSLLMFRVFVSYIFVVVFFLLCTILSDLFSKDFRNQRRRRRRRRSCSCRGCCRSCRRRRCTRSCRARR